MTVATTTKLTRRQAEFASALRSIGGYGDYTFDAAWLDGLAAGDAVAGRIRSLMRPGLIVRETRYEGGYYRALPALWDALLAYLDTHPMEDLAGEWT